MYKTLFKIKNTLKPTPRPKNHFGEFEAGHFYSPVPSKEDVEERFKNIDFSPSSIKDIDFNTEGQLRNLEEFGKFYSEIPFKDEKTAACKYFYLNDSYSYSDGICLYSMIRHLRPKKIIEVGSGYSTTLIDDVNKLFFNEKIDITCIEPYPQKLKRVFGGNLGKIKLREKRLQEISLEVFEGLQENDILFIDSTHVSKANSDVNKIIFEILPRLKSGVYIHFHDIFFPFEYPRIWLEDGCAWNEDYILRAFLMNNKDYKIEFFNTFMSMFYKEKMEALLPNTRKNTGGSLWIKKMPV